MLMAALFIIAKKQKQPKYPLTDGYGHVVHTHTHTLSLSLSLSLSPLPLFSPLPLPPSPPPPPPKWNFLFQLCHAASGVS